MGCFSRKILLTVNDYNITLSRDIKLYQNDAIELCFTILEYETMFTDDNRCIHELVQLVPSKAYMLIESPDGKDYVEATSIRSNEVVFRLSRNHTNFVGIGRLQIVLKDGKVILHSLIPIAIFSNSDSIFARVIFTDLAD